MKSRRRTVVELPELPSQVEALEGRILYAQTPANPRANTLGQSFDAGERQVLLARMSSLPAGTYTALNNALAANDIGTFDATLLSYMRGRTYGNFFFDDSEAGSIAAYANTYLSPGAQITRADSITDLRKFPEQSAVDSYTVQLPADVNWSDGSKSSNPEFLPALNRHEWWVDLAQAYRYTGNTKYIEELRYELADWSYENQTFAVPSKVSTATSYAFDFGIRVENWLMSYFTVLGSSAWTGADNSLMLYKLVQQGDVLSSVAAKLSSFDNNRTIAIGRSELYLGLLLPEVRQATAWKEAGREVLYKSIDGQFYADGSHREQSPGYAVLAIDDLVEARKLDAINGNNWTVAREQTLENAVDALWQQLSPNGNRPAIGDTYRIGATTVFLKAALVLGETRWPEAKARARDAWLFGTSAVDPYRNNPVTPALGTRGNSYSLATGGNYIMRSGNDASARQISFDAGPKGGGHGHYDLLSFELFGYGRPLIADPGAYVYKPGDPKRDWAVSTKAHSTIGIADLNHGELESSTNIKVGGLQSVAGGTMISAGHQGYFFQPGAPTVSRSVWYDGNNTMVVVDFVEATRKQNIEQGFLIENQNAYRDLGNGLIYSRNTDGLGNVRIQSLLRPGQVAGVQTSNVFTTSDAPPNHIDPATRYYVQQNGTTYAVFATLITAHSGNTAGTATATASWVAAPTKPGQSAVLNVNGTNITFTPPEWQRLNAKAESRGTFNDVAYDAAGKLHMAYYDRDTRNLKYAVRDTNGVWSTVQTIDATDYAGYNVSLAIDSKGRPGVAYQEAMNGDLRYASLSNITNAWEVQVVDVKGSTGGYPNLVFTRNNTPAIAYYNKTNGDLRLALADTAGWLIQTIDSKGDVGRFPSIQLDPNRPTASKFAIAYEDTTNADVKWTIQYQTGWRYETVDNSMKISGGYISMKFYDSGTATDRYKGVATYYDAGVGQLRYAYDTGGIEKTLWTSQVIATRKRQGLYSKLDVTGNKPRVFFFDGTNNRAMYLTSTKIAGGKWSMADLGQGGREIHFATFGKSTAFSTLDEATGKMSVLSL